MPGGTGLLLAAGLWMAACRFVPGLAAWWQSTAAQSLSALNALTAAVPFPLAELLIPALAALGVGRSGLRRAATALCAILIVYALLWYPTYFAESAERWPELGPEALEALCLRLSDELNRAPCAQADLREAPAVAGICNAAVKSARYPEWMWKMGVAGLFFPWTGEVIVDACAPPDYVPFTCVHELMHLRGIADEGAANIAAYRACRQWGGGYARSARLWALQCAVAQLSALDSEAACQVVSRLDVRIARLIEPAESSPKANSLARMLGIGRQTTDYSAMIAWLASENPV